MGRSENLEVYQPPLEILYQDERLLAVYKPAGLLVHRSAVDRRETRFLLQLLRDQIGRRTGLASGYAELDRHLPGGGWPRHTLTEILVEHYGIGELEILMPALAHLSAEDPATPHLEPGWIAWVRRF